MGIYWGVKLLECTCIGGGCAVIRLNLTYSVEGFNKQCLLDKTMKLLDRALIGDETA